MQKLVIKKHSTSLRDWVKSTNDVKIFRTGVRSRGKFKEYLYAQYSLIWSPTLLSFFTSKQSKTLMSFLP